MRLGSRSSRFCDWCWCASVATTAARIIYNNAAIAAVATATARIWYVVNRLVGHISVAAIATTAASMNAGWWAAMLEPSVGCRSTGGHHRG